MELVRVVGAAAHDHVRVAVDVLGYRVHDNVGAVVERVLHIWAEEGIVDDDEDAVLVRDGGDFSDIDEGEGRVGGGFDPDEFGFRADQLGDVDFD